MRPGTRWACVREIQNSLKQSVKLLVEDKIKVLGYSGNFGPMEAETKTPGGGSIIYTGMQNHTADSLKSFEGLDGIWFEEASNASEYSLGIIRPTLRKNGSQFWASWNPKSAKDPIEKLLRGPDRVRNSIVVEANYMDNPFLTKKLWDEKEHDRLRDPDRYAHVWLGKYQQASQARVFRNWRADYFDTPIGARFMFGGDFGFSVDPTVLIRCYIVGRTLYIDKEVWKVGCEMDHTPALFAGSDTRNPPRWPNPYGWKGIEGSQRWPMRLDSANPQAISYLRRRGFENITPSVKGPGSVEEGVEFLKSYDIVVHPSCVHVIDELSTYSYKVDKRTEEVLPELMDTKNHTIDSCRYAVEPLRRSSAMPVFGTYGSSS